MKKRNGFTLIELLAVIVILAIIVLIAVPQVIKILNQARISAAEDTTYGIYNATQDYISEILLKNGGDFPSGELTFTCDTTSCKIDNFSSLSSEYNLEEKLDYKGTKVKGGKIIVSNNGTDIVINGLKVNEFVCDYKNEKSECIKLGSLYKKVKIGDYITYDPTKGVDNPENSEILQYTSPKGEFIVKKDSTIIVNNSTSNGAYNLISEYGEIKINNGTIQGRDGNTYIVEKDEHGNGSKTQKYKASSEDNLWRVLDDGSKSGNIRIVPENDIKKIQKDSFNNYTFEIHGLIGYKNIQIELDNISSIYGHGTGAESAKSITLEDINYLTGYDPTTNSRFNENIVVTRVNQNWHRTGYYYSGTTYPGTNTEEKSKIYDMLMRGNRYYWLATNNVTLTNSSLYLNVFRVFGNKVQDDGSTGFFMAVSPWTLQHDGREEQEYNNQYVRPVVTLKKNVNVKSGNGTSDSPWIFQ